MADDRFFPRTHSQPLRREDFVDESRFGDKLVGWVCALVGACLLIAIVVGIYNARTSVHGLTDRIHMGDGGHHQESKSEGARG